MARISTYIKDGSLSPNDKFIGSDGDNGDATVNFTLAAVTTYIEDNATIFTATYVHNQISASTTWTILHNLSKFPSVSVVDTAETVVIGEIKYDSLNQITLTFSAAFAGKAYLN